MAEPFQALIPIVIVVAQGVRNVTSTAENQG